MVLRHCCLVIELLAIQWPHSLWTMQSSTDQKFRIKNCKVHNNLSHPSSLLHSNSKIQHQSIVTIKILYISCIFIISMRAYYLFDKNQLYRHCEICGKRLLHIKLVFKVRRSRMWPKATFGRLKTSIFPVIAVKLNIAI